MKATKEINEPSCLYSTLCLQSNVLRKQTASPSLQCPKPGKTCPRLAYLLKNRISHIEDPYHKEELDCPFCRGRHTNGRLVPHPEGIDIRCPQCGKTMKMLDHGVSRLLNKNFAELDY